MTDSRFTICASVSVDVPARVAFDFLSDGMNQSYWALGSMDRVKVDVDLFRGKSMFTGMDQYIRLSANAELLLVDYFTGDTAAELYQLVESRVRCGSQLGRDKSSCVVTNTIWRCKEDDEEWALMYHLWHTEVHLIKGRLEQIS